MTFSDYASWHCPAAGQEALRGTGGVAGGHLASVSGLDQLL